MMRKRLVWEASANDDLDVKPFSAENPWLESIKVFLWTVWEETVGQSLICGESCTFQHRHNWRGVRTYLWWALYFEHLWERGLFWRAFLVISNIFLWFSTMHFSDPLTYILLERELLWSGSVEIALAEGSRYYRCSTLWTTPCCSAALSNPDIQLAC